MDNSCVIEGYVSPFSTYFSPVLRTFYGFEDEPDRYYDVPLQFTSKSPLLKSFRKLNPNSSVIYQGEYTTTKQYPYIYFSPSQEIKDPPRDSYGYPISIITGVVQEVSKNKIATYKEHYNTLKILTKKNTLLQLYWDSVSWVKYFSTIVGTNVHFKTVLLEGKLVIVSFDYT